ncbi:hypothetical protein H0H93_011428 [Arthromyces matolae]|nr:hypothetical protein H0H93_011428 [Arthromyces matolae]
MQGDTYTVAHRFWEFSGVFTSPIRLTIALVFLYQVLGWSALSGVAVIIVAYAFNYPLANYNISERLTVSKAFTSIALFSHLQGPMTALPNQIFALLNAHVSMQRIEAFFQENEVPDWASSLASTTAAPNAQHEIGFSNAGFEWPSAPGSNLAPPHFQLGPLHFAFPSRKLTLVSGATGSGKTALLTSLLGGLEHATIRDNIIYGAPYGFDTVRYQSVLEGCALVKDLQMFEAGDLTEIGEKGITLSGGQRARVALARALYSAAECILLDDPLAAVDMHTAQHLVMNCLTGPLARDQLSQGKILRKGSIQELEQENLLQAVIDEEDTVVHVQSSTEKDGVSVENSMGEPSRRNGTGKLIEVEARAEGRVPWSTYLTYIRAAGVLPWVLTFAFMLFIRFINIANQVFLAQWGEAYDSTTYFIISTISYPWSGFPSPDRDVKPWLLIYFLISSMGAVSVFFYIGLGYYASLRASRSLFTALLRRLTRAPARFFDITPIGRILNRFTTDINTIDQQLMNSARACISGILDFVASFTVILVVIPSFSPFALFIAWLYIRLAPPYVQASRDLRRLETISLSPTFAGYDELLRGIIHIRAFGMEQRYQDQFYAKVDKFQSFDHAYWLVNAWLRWRYDCLGSVVVFSATMFALWSGVTNGSAAIAIVQAGIFAEASRQLVKVMAQLELDFNSVERVVEYLDVPQEAPAVIEKNRPPAYWPSSSGDLRVENLVVRYAPHLPPVLNNISFTVMPAEKIGIVGIILSLFEYHKAQTSSIRLVELAQSQLVEAYSEALFINTSPTGISSNVYTFSIDGIDITTLGLEDLRTRMRSFLDRAIAPDSFSAGEKQLLSIARAILRRTNVVIMDEATSQIDSNLDDMNSGHNVFLAVHAQSHPIKPREPGPPELINIVDDDILYGTASSNDYGYDYDNPPTPEPTTSTYGGIFDDPFLTRTLTQSSSATSVNTTATSTHPTKHTHQMASATSASSSTSSSTSTVEPTASAFSPPGSSSDTAVIPRSDARQWKIIGLVVICVTVIGVATLAIVFFDAWWGFLRAVLCGRKYGQEREDMVPDWEKRSWEYKIPGEGRYAAIGSMEHLTANAAGIGAGGGRGALKEGAELSAKSQSPIATSSQPIYAPQIDPHPLEPLARRPSTNPRSPYVFSPSYT